MTDHLAIMVIAVIVAITVMLVAATPLASFIEKNPTIVMLALGFLLMIGMTLIADGFGFHVPKGYIYAAMAFSALVEGLNMLSRRRAGRKSSRTQEPSFSQSRPFFGCFPGTLSPSSRQMRSTRLTFTAQPAACSVAAIRR